MSNISSIVPIPPGRAIRILEYWTNFLFLSNKSLVSWSSSDSAKVIEDLFLQKILLHFAAIDSVEIDANEIENTINQRILFD